MSEATGHGAAGGDAAGGEAAGEDTGHEIDVALEVADGWPPVPVETVVVHPTLEGLFVLDRTPVFALDLSRGDTVEARAGDGGRLVFVRRTATGGHATFRIISLADAAALESVLRTLGELGAVVEESEYAALWTVDVPPAAPLDEIRAALENAAAAEVLEFEDPRTP
ncbi:DUF4265 domain-containing protein [Frondihabitans cladoniiphilus]|uniref:DUF4265 domain-containing protein n=1 Tax=Frondihabitans cladoniiphilus TaxID=715785 RepID=A0ABP8W4N7_9MICO